MRARISAEALLVKVTARMPSGDTHSTSMSHAIRCTRTRVLPLPAPASTRHGFGSSSYCLSLRIVQAIKYWRYIHLTDSGVITGWAAGERPAANGKVYRKYLLKNGVASVAAPIMFDLD